MFEARVRVFHVEHWRSSGSSGDGELWRPRRVTHNVPVDKLRISGQPTLRGGRPVADKAHAGGGATGDVIAFTHDSNTGGRLFLVNTGKKTILAYQTAQTSDNGMKLLCGRSYALDEELCAAGGGAEIPYQSRGYNILDVRRELDKINRNAARGR